MCFVMPASADLFILYSRISPWTEDAVTWFGASDSAGVGGILFGGDFLVLNHFCIGLFWQCVVLVIGSYDVNLCGGVDHKPKFASFFLWVDRVCGKCREDE